ncbi:MAG: hypothetical protein ASARMPREDX12_007553 [Alectoria sarmentosa]|nr:MAG: hypothetical protein ASARMPREDX12_007553 [Alectoria sarmentosa]
MADNKALQGNKNEVHEEQKKTGMKFGSELKTPVQHKDTVKEIYQGHSNCSNCGKMCSSHRSRRDTSSDDSSSSGSNSSYVSADEETASSSLENNSNILPGKKSIIDGSKTISQIIQLKKQQRNSSKPQYFRADELWENETHAYRLNETAAVASKDECSEYIFHVQRRFDCNGKYLETVYQRLVFECVMMCDLMVFTWQRSIF